MTETSVRLLPRTERALADARVRAAVRNATDVFTAKRAEALTGLADVDAARDAAHAVRRDALERLDALLDEWEANATANGIVVHRATTAGEATRIVVGLVAASAAARDAGAPVLVAKGKSMASEEIHLNEALERAGHTVVETDLGEFIIQLAGEPPSHLIAPAIHKTRHDVAELFTTDAGRPVEADIPAEAAYARARLRQSFLDAGVGITGVNFALAETGSICLVENEGNGRMCTSLPRVHIAVMGMERIVPTWADLDVMLSVLARSATGQALTVYTNLVSGPRRPGEVDGPDEVHVVVLDNGRRAVLDSDFADALLCIRCGACLNTCPVYRNVGGHAYASVYPGPIGAVLTPLLRPDDELARELPEASTLCGACTDVCPVRIPLHDLLLRLRVRDAPADASTARRLGFRAWSLLWSHPVGYRVSVLGTRVVLRLAARVPRLARRLPGWPGAWTRDRFLPRVRP